jgi:hydrogenase nickel incorporation protein HypA/HybF
MHEIGLCEGIVEAVLRRADGRPVRAVLVRAGVRQRVVLDSLRQAFAMVAAGTVAADAQVDLEVVPVTVDCRTCGDVNESMDPWAVCPSCGGEDVDVTGGDELTVVSVTLRGPATVVAGPGG